MMCVLCVRLILRIVDHLFFKCQVSQEIWAWLCCRFTGNLGLLLKSFKLQFWLASKASSIKAKVYVMCFTETLYCVWCSRNRLVFDNVSVNSRLAARTIVFRVASRCDENVRYSLAKLGLQMKSELNNPP